MDKNSVVWKKLVAMGWPPMSGRVIKERITDWRRLVALYAGDRELCNCGEAYYSHCAGGDECGFCHRDAKAHTYCKDGCSANMIETKEEIAGRVLLALTLSEIGKH